MLNSLNDGKLEKECMITYDSRRVVGMKEVNNNRDKWSLIKEKRFKTQ